MIHFFRRIRKSLLEDNKFRKYIVYAIGEIALVMIGILLALQVNNWNEARKTKFLNQSLLISIKEDLKLDLKQIEFNENFLNEYEKAGLAVQDFLENSTSNIGSSELSRAFMGLHLFRDFSPATTAYENLLSSGAVNLMKNKNIPRLLATYHYESPFATRSIRQRYRLSDEYDPFRIKYLQAGMLRDFLKEAIFSDSTYQSKNYQVDWKRLREDQEYRYLLDQILAMRVPARNRIQIDRNEIVMLLSEIDEELDLVVK